MGGDHLDWLFLANSSGFWHCSWAIGSMWSAGGVLWGFWAFSWMVFAFWPFDFNFDVFGFRNWGHLGMLVGLSSDLLKLFSHSWCGGEAGLLV